MVLRANTDGPEVVTGLRKRIEPWAMEHNHGQIGGLLVLCLGPYRAGEHLKAHDHPFRHVQYVESGAMRLLIGESAIEVVAPNMIEIPARTIHGGTALEDGTRLRCIFIEAETRPYA
jgi:mannose-6-phosphate isomerase-like protein (cupin superfamily)